MSLERAETLAVDRLGQRRSFWSYENRLIAIFALAGGVSGLDALTVYFLIPFIAKDLDLNNTQVGSLSLAVAIGWSTSSLVVGFLSDRFACRKPFVVGAFILFTAFSGLSAAASSFALLLVARLLMGVAEGPVIPVQQAIVMKESSAHRRALNMAIVQNLGAQGIGLLLGPIIVVQLAAAFGWRCAFLVAGVPALIIAWVIARYVREPAISQPPTMSDGIRPSGVLNLFSYHNMRLCTIASAAGATYFFTAMTFLPLWLVRELHFNPGEMSIVMSAIGAAGVVWSIVIPWLADRFGRPRIMALAAAFCFIPPMAALLLGWSLPLLTLLMFLGCMMAAVFPLCATVVLETVPARDAATATATIVATSTIVGNGLGPWFGGMLADKFGLVATLYSELALAGIAASACLALRDTARIKPS